MTSQGEPFNEGFLAFLPGDNDGTHRENDAALRRLSVELRSLLRLTDSAFWKVVKSQPTLHTTLDSFLRFRRRSYDPSETANLGTALPLHILDRQFFFLLLRLATVPEKATLAAQSQQADWLYDQWIIDVPKIFDICVLYGRENSQLVKTLLQKLFQLQPKWLNDIEEMVPTLVDNLYLLQERCSDALVHLQQGKKEGLLGWSDVLKYVLDVCINVMALLEICPSAAGQLMQNRGMLLCSLGNLHDLLLPQLDGALRNADLTETEIKNLLKQLHLTRSALQRAAFLLLKAAYLTQEPQNGTHPPSQSLVERGQEFMNVVMAVAQLEEMDASHSILQCMNRRFHLGDGVIEAINQGMLSLDDAQFDYLSMLVHSVARPESLRPLIPDGKRPVTDLPGPSSSTQPDDLQRATMLSKISEIKEILPDHGDGFLERCLLEFNMETEQVIAHLLEGTLPPSLSSLDPYMPIRDLVPDAPALDGPSTSTAPNGVSKRESFYKQFLFPDKLGPGWDAVYNETPPQTAEIQNWAKVKVGAPRKKVDRKTARILDQSNSEIRQIVIRQANELLVDDYDDEYDDSYDDLGGQGGADGQADVEGDDTSTAPKQSQKPYFVKDGKIYNAPREGAVAVSGLSNAQETAARKEEMIHGLGAGGNLPTGGTSSQPSPPVRGGAPRGRGRRGSGRGRDHHQKQRSLRKQGL